MKLEQETSQKAMLITMHTITVYREEPT